MIKKFSENREIYMENFIKIIHFQLIFNKILRKFLINSDGSYGAEPVAPKLSENGFFASRMAAPVSLKKR